MEEEEWRTVFESYCKWEACCIWRQGCPFLSCDVLYYSLILYEKYFGNISGDVLAHFVRDHFNETFLKSANAEGKLFLQDEDPRQNSKKAKLEFQSIDAIIFPIPLRGPDMNPISIIFSTIK